LEAARKQSQFKANRPASAGNPEQVERVRNGSSGGTYKWLRLKKQSQFAGGQIGVKSVITMVYGILDDWMRRKNKANQSQF